MSLIAVNGVNGVGKSTTAKIIQCVLAGYDDRSILEILRLKHDIDSDWIIKSFADKVNESYTVITGIDFHSLDRAEKEIEHNRFIDFAEGCKKIFNEDIWVNALFKDYKSLCDKYCLKLSATDSFDTCSNIHEQVSNCFPKYIIDDLRFYSEWKKIQEFGGICITIQDGFTDKDMIRYLETQGELDLKETWEEKAQKHYYNYHGNLWLKDNPSCRLNGIYIDWDWVITNTGNIEDLITEIRIMLKELIS